MSEQFNKAYKASVTYLTCKPTHEKTVFWLQLISPMKDIFYASSVFLHKIVFRIPINVRFFPLNIYNIHVSLLDEFSNFIDMLAFAHLPEQL